MSAINGILPGGCYRPGPINSNPTNASTHAEGGRVVFEGMPAKLRKAATPTGRYFAGR